MAPWHHLAAQKSQSKNTLDAESFPSREDVQRTEGVPSALAGRFVGQCLCKHQVTLEVLINQLDDFLTICRVWPDVLIISIESKTWIDLL